MIDVPVEVIPCFFNLRFHLFQNVFLGLAEIHTIALHLLVPAQQIEKLVTYTSNSVYYRQHFR